MSSENSIIILVSTLFGVTILCSVVVFLCRCLGRRNNNSVTTVPNTQAQVPSGQQPPQSIQLPQLPPISQQSRPQQHDEQGTDVSEQLPDQTDAATVNVGSNMSRQDSISGSLEGEESSSQN